MPVEPVGKSVSGQLPVIVSPGDPAGVGPEISLKAWLEGCRDFVLIGDEAHLSGLASQMGWAVPLARWAGGPVHHDALHIWPVSWAEPPVAGQDNAANSRQIIQAIEDATQMVKSGKAAAITTNPIHKSHLYQAGFDYPGHTEFLAALDGRSGDEMMMLANPALRVVPATIHIPLRDVGDALETEQLSALFRRLSQSMRADFGLAQPRIAVCGLNPHAGESGHLGREEEKILKPAIEKATKSGVVLSGPHPADSLFHAAARQHYDVVVGMYHDQVLIPVKMLDFHGSVNITLGLSFVRTSPDHGTAYDIAGTGAANPKSLMAAIEMAHEMATARQAFYNEAKP